MLNKNKRFLPAYVNLSPIEFVRKREDSWRSFFPFSSGNGMWTFSGRVALKEGLRRIGLTPGTTILVPSYFQGTEIDTLIAAGYRLKFYRIERDFGVDLSDVENKVDEKVTALFIIHYFGLPQPLAAIEEFCRRRSLALIEDCALSLFSRDRDTWLGSRGDMALFSVHKTLPLPHGGFLACKVGGSSKLEPPPVHSTILQTADLLAQAAKCAMSSRTVDNLWNKTSGKRAALAGRTVVSGAITLDPAVFRYSVSSLTLRLMGLCNPAEIIDRRRANFLQLHELLDGTACRPLKGLPDGACPLFYPVIVENKFAFRDELFRLGIGSVNLWSRSHPACPDAADVVYLRRGMLELPIHQQLDHDDIKRIGEAVARLLAKKRVAAAGQMSRAEELQIRDPVQAPGFEKSGGRIPFSR